MKKKKWLALILSTVMASTMITPMNAFAGEECNHWYAWEHDVDTNQCYKKCTNCGETKEVDNIWYKWFEDEDGNHYKHCIHCDNSAFDKERATHNFWWKNDPNTNEHWKECSECGLQKERGTHNFWWKNDPNTNEHWKECSECGLQKERGTHNFWWKNDPNTNEHWKECSECGLQKERGTHNFWWKNDPNTNEHWKECSECGLQKERGTHNFCEKNDPETNEHWKECSECGLQTERETQEKMANPTAYLNKNLVTVVNCQNEAHTGEQQSQVFKGMIYGGLELSSFNEATNSIDVTVNTDAYLNAFNKKYPGHTLVLGTEDPNFTITWNEKTNSWSGAKEFVNIYVKCDTKRASEYAYLNKNLVTVVNCQNEAHTGEQQSQVFKGMIYGGLELSSFNEATNSIDVTVNADPYLNAFNKTYPGHTLVLGTEDPNFTITWDEKTNSWSGAEEFVNIYVKCDTKRASEVAYLNRNLVTVVNCQNEAHTGEQQSQVFKGMIYGGLELSSFNEVTNSIDVTVNTNAYLNAFNKTYPGHTLVLGTEDPNFTITWNEKTNSWSGAEEFVNIYVKCDTKRASEYAYLNKNLVTVVNCQNEAHTGEQQSQVFKGMIYGGLELSSFNEATNSIDVTVNADPYLNAFNKTYPGHTLVLGTEDPNFTITWDEKTNSWSGAEEFVNIYVKCDTKRASEVAYLNRNLMTIVNCQNEAHTGEQQSQVFKGMIYGGLELSSFNEVTNSIDVTVNTNAYLNAFNKTYPGHTLVLGTEDPNFTITWNEKTNSWSGAEEFVNIYVKCDTKRASEYAYLNKNLVTVVNCQNEAHTGEQQSQVFKGMIYGGLELSSFNEATNSIDVTVNTDAYLNAFNKKYPGHTLVLGTEDPNFTITWDEKTNSWSGAEEFVNIHVKCERKITVKLVSRYGYMNKAEKETTRTYVFRENSNATRRYPSVYSRKGYKYDNVGWCFKGSDRYHIIKAGKKLNFDILEDCVSFDKNGNAYVTIKDRNLSRR